MTELDAQHRAQLAETLAEHTYDYPDSFCGCGKHFDRPWFEWQAHVADALAPLVAEWLAGARANALREAADDIERQRDEFEAEDKAEGCDSRFCGGWLLGQTHAVQVLRDRANRGGDS